MSKIRVLVTIPQPLRDLVLAPETLAELRSFADVTLNEDGRNWDAEALCARLPGVDAILGSWGLPQLTSEVLSQADRLSFVAYAAGSIKPFMTDAAYDRGIRVTHAAARIAESVADITLVLAMMGLRRPQDFDRRLKSGEALARCARGGHIRDTRQDGGPAGAGLCRPAHSGALSSGGGAGLGL